MRRPRADTGIRRVERAADLPDAWDALADTCFRTRAFLSHAERTNPCDQRYYVLVDAGILKAGAILYTLPLDVFTYLGSSATVAGHAIRRVLDSLPPIRLRLRVLGVPCSVAWPGLLGDIWDQSRLLRRIIREERGFILGLNTNGPVDLPGAAQGRTLPTVVLDRSFEDFRAYRAALRSPYRRRLDWIQARWESVERRVQPMHAFDGDMHTLYLQAFERSEAKLECLSHAFFRGLPDEFRLTTYHVGRRMIGWHITAWDAIAARCTFFMGGTRQDTNAPLHTYFNVLVGVIEEAIDRGARVIDLGQTAEIPKTRLGGRLSERGMFAWVPGPPCRALLRYLGPRLEYRREVPVLRVFRGDE